MIVGSVGFLAASILPYAMDAMGTPLPTSPRMLHGIEAAPPVTTDLASAVTSATTVTEFSATATTVANTFTNAAAASSAGAGLEGFVEANPALAVGVSLGVVSAATIVSVETLFSGF